MHNRAAHKVGEIVTLTELTYADIGCVLKQQDNSARFFSDNYILGALKTTYEKICAATPFVRGGVSTTYHAISLVVPKDAPPEIRIPQPKAGDLLFITDVKLFYSSSELDSTFDPPRMPRYRKTLVRALTEDGEGIGAILFSSVIEYLVVSEGQGLP